MMWIGGPTTGHLCARPAPGRRRQVWRCGECGELWRSTYGGTWAPATLWQRWRYRKYRAER
jgi:ribosomal protein L37AE/L43A